MASPVARARRGASVSAALTPLVPQIVRMGTDPDRREAFGRRLRAVADRLGGVYPWLAELIADLPALTGAALAGGVGAPTTRPFVHATIHTDGSMILREDGEAARAELDIELFDIALRLLRPFTGHLSSELTRGMLAMLREQVAHESSLEDEALERRRLGQLGDGIRSVPLVPDPTGGWDQGRLPTATDPSVVGLVAMATTWVDLVARRAFVPARLDWTSYRPVEGEASVVLNRLGGSTEARDLVRTFVRELGAAEPSQIPPGLLVLLSEDLGCDPSQVEDLARSVMSFVDPTRWPAHLGPLAALSRIDAAARTWEGRPTLHRDTLLVIRQLGIFRRLADELDHAPSLFRPVGGA